MALEVPPDPIVVVSRPAGKQLRAGVQQQAGRFRGRGGDDHHVGGLDIQPALGVEIFHTLGTAMIVDDDLADHRFRPQLAVARGQGHGYHRVLRAVFGISRASETDAIDAMHARRPAVVGDGIAEHGYREGVPAQPLRGRRQDLGLGVVGESGHGPRLLARRRKRIRAIVARDADLPFRLLVARFEIFVGDRPIFERRAFERTVGRSQLEVLRHETPGHGPVADGAAADARGDVVVGPVARQNHALRAAGLDNHPAIAAIIGPVAVAQDRSPLRHQLVVAMFLIGNPFAALEKNDGEPRHRQFLGNDAAAGPGPHHDRVDMPICHSCTPLRVTVCRLDPAWESLGGDTRG